MINNKILTILIFLLIGLTRQIVFIWNMTADVRS